MNVEELTAILKKIKKNLDEEIEQKRNVNLLRESYIKNLPIIREHFLNDLIHGGVPRDIIPEKLKEYDIDIDNAQKWVTAAVHLEPDENVDKALSLHKERELIPISVRNMIEEKLDGQFRFIMFHSSFESVLIAALDALRQVGLENYAHSYPDELSGGMRQRVGLARALAINPDILLMDEAFSALDPLIRTEMQDELVKLQAKHQRTIVFISHDLDEAMRIGDRIAIMQNGEVVQVGTPDEILNNPANDYVRTFFRGVDISQVFSAKDIARRTPNGLIRKTPGFGPRSALKLLQDEDREYGYVIERGNKFVGAVSIDSLKAALTQQQGLDAALIDAPLAVDAQTPLSELLSHVGQAPCAVPVVDEDQQYVGIISKGMLLRALDREGVNNGLSK